MLRDTETAVHGCGHEDKQLPIRQGGGRAIACPANQVVVSLQQVSILAHLPKQHFTGVRNFNSIFVH
jgi:hypothetical protein